MVNSGYATIACGMAAVTVFVSFFLLGFSFDTIDPNYLGFVYDANVMKLETDKLYNAEIDDPNGGRQFVGLGRSFGDYRYPRYAKRLLFDGSSSDVAAAADDPESTGPHSTRITAKTRDGLSIDLAMSFQYQLTRSAEAMASLAINFGSAAAAEQLYIRYARREVRDAVSRFEMLDLWKQRPNVTAAVFEAVRTRLAKVQATVTGLQLLSLDIPLQVQEAVQTTTVEEQKIEEKRQLQQVAIVEVRTRQLQARQDAEVTVIQANASAATRIIDARAQAQALTIRVKGQENSYVASRDELNFTNAELLDYLQMRAIINSKGRVIINAPAPPGSA